MQDVSSDQQIYKKQMKKIIFLIIGCLVLISVSLGMFYFLSTPGLKSSQIEQILGAGIFLGLIGIGIIVLGFSKKQNNNQETECEEQECDIAQA
jgi:flagellar basal body-associated protein FliL